MKRISILAAILLSSSAHAEPTVAEVEDRANALISSVISQRDANANMAAKAQADVTILNATVARLTKEIEALKAAQPKKEGPK